MCYSTHAVSYIMFPFADLCNETLGYHPCMDGTCYEEEQRCDGTRNCQDGQDEMGCKILFVLSYISKFYLLLILSLRMQSAILYLHIDTIRQTGQDRISGTVFWYFYLLGKGGIFLVALICLFVCLSVSSVTQKVMTRLQRNFMEEWKVIQGTCD